MQDAAGRGFDFMSKHLGEQRMYMVNHCYMHNVMGVCSVWQQDKSCTYVMIEKPLPLASHIQHHLYYMLAVSRSDFTLIIL